HWWRSIRRPAGLPPPGRGNCTFSLTYSRLRSLPGGRHSDLPATPYELVTVGYSNHRSGKHTKQRSIADGTSLAVFSVESTGIVAAWPRLGAAALTHC